MTLNLHGTLIMTCIVILRVRVSSCIINMLIDDNKPTGELVPFCPTKRKNFLVLSAWGTFLLSRVRCFLTALGDRGKNKGRKEQLRNST